MSVSHDNILLQSILKQKLANNSNYSNFCKQCRSSSFPIWVHGTKSAFSAYILAQLFRVVNKSLMIITASEAEISALRSDMELFGIKSLHLPSYGTLPYSIPSAHSPVWLQRMHVFSELLRSKEGNRMVCIAAWHALAVKLPPLSHILKKQILLKKNTDIDTVYIAKSLTDIGYLRVPQVKVQGEFALRGEVLDVFVPGSNAAVRVFMEYDNIYDIRFFDTQTQVTNKKVAEVLIHPLTETYDSYQRWMDMQANRELWHNTVETQELSYELFQQQAPYWAAAELQENTGVLSCLEGIEILPIWKDYTRIAASAASIRNEYEVQFAQMHKPVPKPEHVLIDIQAAKNHYVSSSVFFDFSQKRNNENTHYTFRCDSPQSFFGNIDYLKTELLNLHKHGKTVLICTDSEAQQHRMQFLLKEHDVSVLCAYISSGFSLPEENIVVIQENEVFGRRVRRKADFSKLETKPLDTFLSLETGDYVVHLNYGIGKFLGIERLKTVRNERDYIQIEYADEEMIFLPIEQVNLIQRYIGSAGTTPRLDKIGSKNWEKRKSNAKKHTEDLADKLIQLFSERQQVKGFRFPADTEWQAEFEAAFPYEETADQLKCMKEIKHDMEKDRPMDRLLCGDVGYGKTELGLRAAFKAVVSGKQVAFLAPTTILAEQHYEHMLERFSGFPVNIAMLSRLIDKRKQVSIISMLSSGTVDVVVGTHRLLQKDVSFHTLGLLIIDEEQRFGVKAKARLKELRVNVDSLTLTATPIPRTLHMSLLKIWDISILASPPSNRRPIETVVQPFNVETVLHAIKKEVQRGGQVFFLHNRIETLESTVDFIRGLLPEVIVHYAHGQMQPQDLEDIMHRFIHGGIHVLAATTIIENGINIPNVNTIIIDRADMYGISQLYQLRGRVGRSDKTAYAYLLYPEKTFLSERAMKRLEIITEHTELGSGFKIALKDMEVRGAGNILGSQQSGDIATVGFDLYLKLLDTAIRNREKAAPKTAEDVYLEFEYTGFLPDSYIAEPMEKMEVYKKIAAVTSDAELEILERELEDRFGKMPEEVESLLSLAEIRIICRQLHVGSMKEKNGRLYIEFAFVASMSVEKILSMLKHSNSRIDPKKPNVLIMNTSKVGLKEKSEFIRGHLSQLL